MSDLEYVDNQWELDNSRNPRVTKQQQKKQFALLLWREDFENLEKQIDRKKIDEKDTWTDIYQIIGFFSVFQGVWFQGVTQLAAQRSCRFCIIPIILSVLVSISTIAGVYVKFSKVRILRKGFYKDKLDSKIRESRITAFGREGLKFDLKKIEEAPNQSIANLKSVFEEELAEAHRTRVFVLAFLAIFSGLFAWLIYTMKTEIKNSCGSPVLLREGNMGIYRDVKLIPHGRSHMIEMDPNATYREYILVIQVEGALHRSGEQFVTSDDCIDYSVIEVVQDSTGNYSQKKTHRHFNTAVKQPSTNRFFRFLKFLWTGDSSLG